MTQPTPQNSNSPLDPEPCANWRPSLDCNAETCHRKPSCAGCNGDDINCGTYSDHDSRNARIKDHSYEENILNWRENRLERAMEFVRLIPRFDRVPRRAYG